MANDMKSVWPAVLVVCILLVVSQFFVAGAINSSIKSNTNKSVEIDLTDVTNAINDLSNKIDTQDNITDNDKIDYIYDEMSEDDVIEAKALELAEDYLEDKDFLEDLSIFLNTADNETTTDIIEGCGLSGIDEDDLSVEVLDSEVNRDGTTDTYFVNFDLKVYEDGDKIAKVKNVIITVEDVDYDEAFEDIEVIEEVDFTKIETVRVY